MKVFLKLIVAGAVIAGAWWGWTVIRSQEEIQVEYRVSPMAKEDIRLTIDATGTIEPTELVDVGAQVGGRIIEFGKDVEGKTVDYSSEVKEGQLLARIDDVLVESDIQKAEAMVNQAKANILSSKANILQAKAKHVQMARDRERAEKLGPGQALSKTSYDQYISDEEMARAAVEVAEASLAQTEANLQSAEASLRKEMLNRGYTKIQSPLDGVVVTRLVDIGQTVVSSMSAPSLFKIARDLSDIQVWAAVNEADIGSIYRGQKAIFTVEAFPGMEFEGTVNKIRLNATMTSNVVTYIVEIDAKNPNKILKLYLTADVNFIVEDLKDAFVVPNAALRYMPTDDLIDPSVKNDYMAEVAKMSVEKPEVAVPTGGKTRTKSVIWEQKGKFVVPVYVEAGESNGMVTPVFADGLREGMPIVLGATRLDDGGDKALDNSETTNPFMPKMPKRNKNQKRSGDNPPPPRK